MGNTIADVDTPMDIYSRCRAMVEALDQERGWCLDDVTCQRYIMGLLPHIMSDHTDITLRTIVANYHTEHVFVEALRDRQHRSHEESWESWAKQVVAILRAAGGDWSYDSMVSSEDLEQIARLELVRSLATYHYHSRFSTWAHSVIVKSLYRHRRNQQASKRSGDVVSLDESPVLDASSARVDHPEDLASALMLLEQINVVLGTHHDDRLRQIFHLWAVKDIQVEEIGRQIHLSPSRTRTLLRLARQLLREHPDIQAWLEDE